MKKICCAILAVLCILPCLAGCGKKDKYVEYRITLSDDLTQPGTVTMQFDEEGNLSMDSSETDAKKEESLERNVATGQVEESEDLEDEE